MGTTKDQGVYFFVLHLFQVSACHNLCDRIFSPALFYQWHEQRQGFPITVISGSICWISSLYRWLLMVASVAITPTLFFVVSLAATLAPGFTTPMIGMSISFQGYQVPAHWLYCRRSQSLSRPVFAGIGRSVWNIG